MKWGLFRELGYGIGRLAPVGQLCDGFGDTVSSISLFLHPWIWAVSFLTL